MVLIFCCVCDHGHNKLFIQLGTYLFRKAFSSKFTLRSKHLFLFYFCRDDFRIVIMSSISGLSLPQNRENVQHKNKSEFAFSLSSQSAEIDGKDVDNYDPFQASMQQMEVIWKPLLTCSINLRYNIVK